MSEATADKVRALLPEISVRAVQIEQARAVPRDLIEKLRSAGVFRRYVPRSHGGDEVWPDEGLTVIEELARADASVAWVAAVGSEGPSFYAYLPPGTYDKIYAAGPDVVHTGVINATGRAVRDGDGYRFSGRWSFASCCATADYICINAILDGAEPAASGPPPTRFGVVPASDVQIDDVWHVSGLKGTGSNDIVVDGLFIPEDWTGTFTDLPKVARHPLDQRPLLARFGTEFAAVAVGIAQGALDDIIDIARGKVPAMSQSKLAADPVAQYMVGSLATDLHMARTLLHDVARADQASAGTTPDNTATLIRRARLARAASVAASVVEGCYTVSGTTGLFESCPLQRRLRDVRAVTQHFLLSVRSAFGPVGAAVLKEGPAR
jgi:alkylation response protein AidB-like acyl-CoA dehydrogenase